MLLKLPEQIPQSTYLILAPTNPSSTEQWCFYPQGADTLQAQIDMSGLRRIHIIGGPASGKSTLARRIGPQLGLPVYDLDKIAFEGLEFTERPLGARLADIRGILKQPAWITEGIFLGWTDELLRMADTIIWLDYIGWPRAVWRIVKRFLQGGVEEARRQQGARKVNRFHDYARNLRLLVAVLFSSRRYYHTRLKDIPAGACIESRVVTAQCLMSYRDKVVRCAKAADVQFVLDSILARGERAIDYNPARLSTTQPTGSGANGVRNENSPI